ncbi:MAG: porin family protein [Chlorobium sp.]|nr:MAG: porin family protein [Chlorobium sp.]
MKKLLLTALIAGMSAAPALAGTPYVSGSIGLGLLNNGSFTPTGGVKEDVKFDSGVAFGGAIGIKQDDFRIEAALAHQSNDFQNSTHSVSELSYMVNGYYDINLDKSSVSPFVTVGLGGVSAKPENGDSKSALAWQIGAGVGVKASKDLTVDLGVRYTKPSAFKYSDGEFKVSSTNILAGVRYGF